MEAVQILLAALEGRAQAQEAAPRLVVPALPFRPVERVVAEAPRAEASWEATEERRAGRVRVPQVR